MLDVTSQSPMAGFQAKYVHAVNVHQGRTISKYALQTARVVSFAALGGFLGALVMSVILIVSKVMMGLPAMADFIVMGIFAGGQGESVVAIGWVAHFLTGIIVGIVFGLVTSHISRLGIGGIEKGIGLGLAYGVVVYVVLFIPLLTLGFAPIMMAMMGPAAASMAPIVLAIGFIEHLVYGAVLGGGVALGWKQR